MIHVLRAGKILKMINITNFPFARYRLSDRFGPLLTFDKEKYYKIRDVETISNYVIEEIKKHVSNDMQWYLDSAENFKIELSLHRKCRAMAIPAEFSGINVFNQRLLDNYQSIEKRLRTITRGNKNKKIIEHDIRELTIYMRMYFEIDIMRHMFPKVYPMGNPFAGIIALMQEGAVIVRFKYVRIQYKAKPVELLTSYHLMRNNMLAVHVEGAGFVGTKKWGEGDDKIKFHSYSMALSIRWGIDDFNKKGKFTY